MVYDIEANAVGRGCSINERMRVEPGAQDDGSNFGMINSLALDASGSLLVLGGDAKRVQMWSLPRDQSGETSAASKATQVSAQSSKASLSSFTECVQEGLKELSRGVRLPITTAAALARRSSSPPVTTRSQALDNAPGVEMPMPGPRASMGIAEAEELSQLQIGRRSSRGGGDLPLGSFTPTIAAWACIGDDPQQWEWRWRGRIYLLRPAKGTRLDDVAPLARARARR